MTKSTAVAVSAADPALTETATTLAHDLGLPLCPPSCRDYPHVLTLGTERLELRTCQGETAGPIYVDFIAGAMGFRARRARRGKEPLARAVGLKGTDIPTVLDATAGLGRDTFILAALGCPVTVVERSPVIAALLRDGIARARTHFDTRTAARRMTLISGDATAVLRRLTEDERPDVVYLDPMYPHRSKSALVKKEMRILRALVGEDPDAPQLLETALRTARRRVVVKRPRLAPALPGVAPSHTLTGNTTRFDIYLITRNADSG